MRLPRDLSGDDLVRALARFGYVETRQTGSHIRLTAANPGIVDEVAKHHGVSHDEAARRLFGS